MPLGVRGRKGPVLPLRSEVIGRRSYAAARDIEVAIRPQVATEAIRRKRKIVVKPELQPAFSRILLRRLKLQVDLPLDVLVKQNTAPVLVGEFAGCGRVGVAILRRPGVPVPDIAVLLVQALVES